MRFSKFICQIQFSSGLSVERKQVHRQFSRLDLAKILPVGESLRWEKHISSFVSSVYVTRFQVEFGRIQSNQFNVFL